MIDAADKKIGIRVFWLYMGVFWAVLMVILVVQGMQLGRGIGIGDGRINPDGQRYENGTFDGVKAVGR